MAGVLVFLTYLAVILLMGLLTSVVSQKFRIPNILLLLLIGIGLGRVDYKGGPLIEFPELFMTGISILALVMIVFDSSSRFSLKKVDYFSLHTLWLSIVFLVFNLIFLTVFTMLIFGVKSIFLALMFAALMSGTSPAVVLSMFKNVKNKVFDFLGLESLLNTPLVVLIPFIILDLKTALKDELGIAVFIDQLVPVLQQFVVGVGAGVLIGLIMFKFMRKAYSVVLSPLAVITSALLAYIIAENLDGNGVLAVTSMGLLFGNVYVKQKFQLREFASVFSNSLEILVFVLIGIVIAIPFSMEFFIKSLVLFLLYLLIRFFSIIFSLRGMDFTIEEKIFMSLNVQKGIAVAVVVFSLATFQIEGMQTILNLSLTFMLYSIVLSSVILRFAKLFIKDIRGKKA
ncbi:MAG: cation:proton antiporter [Candidatus Woesearchaeota archaeon]|jgi:NhaP-type Na+/H+ or K+/H+ antiporter|nr:cation:proton antiporter [Candidatus Woesearchaeota archaeon]MDP7322456.1 cation:proton antiporter [Candidatus Woesearchaeota archaeon]MDP7476279.1 cation:proton antiporter [Candidatus Woesearchaeota archaeon]HJO01949.1 cation:proton antiporter [Candidatus Woesearchaeota archaeon]|tara:strand:+ start:12 stop:1208 length:1197 start_codon:yes stop_codon:yes gene_type:complete